MSLAAGVIGACGQLNGRGVNLGFVQSSLQAGSDGSISIIYQNGDKCGSGGRYSTRVIFQCDDSPVSTISLFDFSAISHLVSFTLFHIWKFLLLTNKKVQNGLLTFLNWQTKMKFLLLCYLKGSPMFDRKDGCEYVFIWRTSEACPVKRVQGTI